MTNSEITIKCPECGHEFDVSDVLYHQVEHELKLDFDARLKAERDKYRSQTEALEQQREQLDKARAQQDEIVSTAIRQQLQQQTQVLEKKLSSAIREEQSSQLKALQEELAQKSEQVKALHKAQADIERLKREKDEVQGKTQP